MLTPVNPNATASNLPKLHGSETRAAPGHNPIVSIQPPSASVDNPAGMGIEPSTLFASVSAETAMAGNRTILQTLATVVANRLNMTRNANEPMEALFLRIAAAIDELPESARQALAASAGLKLLKLQLADLALALRKPESAAAARFVATAETPLATPLKTAAAAATTTYLQQGVTASRTAEAMAMGTQARIGSGSLGIFAASTSMSMLADGAQNDARGLQLQLRTMFEPGIAETRRELAERATLAGLVVSGLPDVATTGTAQDEANESVQQPVSTEAQAEAENLTESQVALPESSTDDGNQHLQQTRSQTLPVAENNNRPSLVERVKPMGREIILERLQDQNRLAEKALFGERPIETLLALKGISEVFPAPPAETAELAKPSLLSAEADDRTGKTVKADTAGNFIETAEAAARDSDAQALRVRTGAHAATFYPAAANDETDIGSQAKQDPSEPSPESKAATQEQLSAAVLKSATIAEPVPFAYVALQPARERFDDKAGAEESRPGREDDTDQRRNDQEDAEKRHERLAQKAQDDLLTPEPQTVQTPRITRDSSDADRAYALYQRMADF